MASDADNFAADLLLVPNTGDKLAADAALDLVVANVPGAAVVAPTPTTPQGSTPRAFGRSWQFDFERGTFVRHGRSPAETTGIETLRGWIEKAMRTTRYAHFIYSDYYGVDTVDVIGEQFDGGQLSALGAAITDALLVHDRIVDVSDMTFDRPDDKDDYVLVSFTVVTDTAELEFTLPVGP